MFLSSFLCYIGVRKEVESLKLTLTCHLDFDQEMISIIEEIRLNSSKFYNMVLFEIRQDNILELNDYYYFQLVKR